MRNVLSPLLVLAFISGCGKAAAPKTKVVVPVDQVPAVIMTAAHKKEPEVNFNKVIKSPDEFYEVQGKTKAGKIVELEVSESGEVLKVE
jgi:hypothetical protein